MKGSVRLNGEYSKPFGNKNGLRQGCVIAPNLFDLFFARVIAVAVERASGLGIMFRLKINGKLFDTRGAAELLVRELLFADNAAIVRDNPSEIMHCLAQSISDWGLTLSIGKTKVLYQPAPGNWSELLSFVVGDNTLENVTKFQYLGSVLTRDKTLDEEIKNRLSHANYSFGRLAKKVWLNRHVSPRTKVKVYKAFVITSFLYGCQSWCTYKHYEKKLEAFHQKCLRKILGIKWQQNVTNNVVLERAGIPKMESVLHVGGWRMLVGWMTSDFPSKFCLAN